MIQQQRHDWILSFLAERDILSVEEAVRQLDASPATVRRDFNELAKNNLIRRTRGGIKRIANSINGVTPYPLREVRFAKEKHALASKAASLLQSGDVVMVDGGTTTFHLTNCLPKFPLRIITNSLRLANVLGEKRVGETPLEIFLSGGHLYPFSGQLIGPQARAGLSQYNADWAFISVGGINEENLFYSNELVVETEQAMIANADKVVVLADHSKIGKRAMCHLCSLNRVHILITDFWPEHETMYTRIKEAGVEVITVETDAHTS